MSSIFINELSITVPGNVVKNNDKDGNSILRFTQDQLQSLYDSAGPVLEFFAAQTSQTKPVSAVGETSSTGKPVSDKNTSAEGAA